MRPLRPGPALASSLWLASSLASWHAFRKALADPDGAQEERVLGIVRRNEETAFGRAHAFGSIRSLADFRARVPLTEPGDLLPWTSRIACGERAVLTSEPVDLLVPTSGTTGATKLVPFTASFRREVDAAVAPWIAGLLLGDPRLLGGPHFWAVSPVLASDRRSETAVPVGFPDDTRYLRRAAAALASAVQAVPAAVRHLDDLGTFRHVTLLHLLRARGLRLVSVWSPTFLTLLLEALPALAEGLLRDLRDGTLRPPNPVQAPLLASLSRGLSPDPRRAAEVERALGFAGSAGKRHALLWPSLRLVSAWADAASRREADTLAALLPHARFQPKGLAATEGITSIPFGNGDADGDPDSGVLAIRGHGIELLPEGGGGPTALSAARTGGTYEIVLTTGAGLYRHRTGDLVVVTGREGRTPRVRFLGRRGLVSDRVGEKLEGRFAEEAGTAALKKAGLEVRFALLALEEGPSPPSYVFFLEPAGVVPDAWLQAASEALEERLLASFHYRYARELGQLGAVRAFRVTGSGREAVAAARLAAGGRAGDAKPDLLSRQTGWAGRLPGRLLGGPDGILGP